MTPTLVSHSSERRLRSSTRAGFTLAGVLLVALVGLHAGCDDSSSEDGGGAGSAGQGGGTAGSGGAGGAGGSGGGSAGHGGEAGGSGGGGTGGLGGTGGTGGTGGLGGSGGSGGSGGLGGSGGTGGSGGLGGTGGTGGTGTGTGGSGGLAPAWGVISGQCGELDSVEILAPSPFYFENAVDFGAQAYDYALLTPGGQEVWDDGNLGGSSIHSEILSMEVLNRCDGATLLKTEGEVTYLDPAGKKTDLLVSLDGHVVGVSVTRAYHFPPADPYTPAEAFALLERKLDDILVSTANVAPADAWEKQILHVLVYDPSYLPTLADAYALLDDQTRADTILLLTVTNGDDSVVY